MKLPLRFLLLLPILSTLVGCTGVPKNSINIITPYGSYDINTPKNVLIEGFQASISSNGLLSITFARWSSTNDEMVIDKAGAAQIGQINAWSALVQQAVAAGVKAAAKP